MRKVYKTLIIIGIIIAILATTTLVWQLTRPKGQSRDEVNIDPANNTYIDNVSVNIDDCTPNQCLFILAGKLKKFDSYYATILGEVNAGGIYTQKVSGEKYSVSSASCYVSRSTSSLKNTAKQIYIKNDNVLVRDGNPKTNKYEDSVTRYIVADYINEYGIDYRNLSNYELNETTISNSSLVSKQDGKYTYRYEINIDNGVTGYRVNMYKMGDLGELPTMKKCTLEVVMTNDFQPITITHIDEYSVNYIFTLNCKSTLIETFEKINDSSITIPELTFFESKLNQQ